MSLPLSLQVHTHQHTYPIIISTQTPLTVKLAPYIRAKQVLIVSNQTVAPLYLARLQAALADFELATCILPDGEDYKNQDSINAIYDTLMAQHFGRDCTLIALGGGVIGDMTGFAAASFMRGVDFIQMPTTLLAQVDSSVGGKTGINHPLGKNMIGAFWQPKCVLVDIMTLQSLPKREFLAGLAEVVKYALIMDAQFADWLLAHRHQILSYQTDILAQMVYRCCQYKAAIVAEDEKEQGRRALLNLGHTFGHAIETYMGYGVWLHGEAVAAGMAQAAALSYLQGSLQLEDAQRVIAILQAFELPIQAPSMAVDTALQLMGHDKKIKHGRMHFVLMNGIGNAFVSADIDHDKLVRVLTQPIDCLINE